MRDVIILARKHGSKTMELLSGPEIPAHEQSAKFKEFCKVSVHPELAQVELWDSGSGRQKSRDLLSPKEAAEKAKRDAKSAADAEAKRKSAEAAAKNKPQSAASKP